MPAAESSWLHRLTGTLIRFRNPLLILALLLTGLSLPLVKQLAFEQSVEALYANDDPHLLDYLRSKASFGGDEFAVVGYPVTDLFQADGEQLTLEHDAEIRQFAAELSAIKGVRAVSTQHLAEGLDPHREMHPLIRYLIKRSRPELREFLGGVLVNEDGTVTAIVLRLVPEDQTTTPRAETLAEIRKQAHSHSPRAYVVGEPVQVHDMFRYVEQDGQLLFYVSLGLLSVVLLILFRSIRWVLLPLLVVSTTILWTDAILVLSQIKLSMVSSMMNSLVTIISLAAVTHITVNYRELRRDSKRQDAIRETLTRMLPPIFWTCVTTAVGFAALLSSEITPVKSFGLMMSLASLMVIVSVALTVPGLALLGRFDPDPQRTPGERRLMRALSRVNSEVERHPIWFVTGFCLIVAAAASGLSQLRVETDFSKNFRETSLIVQALNFMETELGGAGTWEVSFPAPQKLNKPYLERVRKLAAELRAIRYPDQETDEQPVTKVVALTDGLDVFPKIAGTLPLQTQLDRVKEVQPEFLSSLYDADAGRMRIVLRARERQSSEAKLWLINRVEEVTREAFPEAKAEDAPTASGLFVLLTFLIESLLRDQLVSFGLAAIGISITMSIALRNPVLGLASLIPNLFPIVLVIGVMGWLDLPINIATAMIASVSLGLSVDSSIHYLSSYRRERGQGASVSRALDLTQQHVGRALVFENVALIAGFSVLTLSQFIPLVYFGALVCVAMFGGLVGNLTLLPLLVQAIDGRRERNTGKAVSAGTVDTPTSAESNETTKIRPPDSEPE